MSRVAAIDCGTNSVRLLVADVSGAGLTTRLRRMEIVRLGEGVDRTGRLSAAAIARARAVLVDYAAEIARLGAERVRMVATSASRDAANAAEFTGMVHELLGIEPAVLSGDEEARLSFTGAVRGLPAGAYLVVDIGGGSTEFVMGDTEAANALSGAEGKAREACRSGGDGLGGAISVDIGCVRMTERHLHSDPPDPAEVAAAEADITAAVDHALATVGSGTLVGLAGSVATVTAIALGLPEYDATRIHNARVPYHQVAKVTADLLGMTNDQRRALPVMHPGRADVIGAGALILRVVMERAGAESVIASEHDILDGIAWSLA